MALQGLAPLAILGYKLYKTGKNVAKGISRAAKPSKGIGSATLSQGTTGRAVLGSGAIGVTAGANLPEKPKKRKKVIDSRTNVSSRMKATERGIGPQLGDKRRKVKKTKSKATSLPVPKRKPTPPKQKKTTDRIPGPDETEVFINKDAVIDYKQLPKVKRKAGGDLKPIDPETQPGLAALKKESPETVNKMGYAKKGGRIVAAMKGGQIVSMMYDD